MVPGLKFICALYLCITNLLSCDLIKETADNLLRQRVVTVLLYCLGGIRNFASNSNAVRKWALNRAEQSKNTGNLKDKAGTATKSRMHTCLRPSRILQSNKAVCEVMRVLTDEYINPFDTLLDHNQLFHLSSGVSMQSTDVLNCWEIGNERFKEFERKRIIDQVIPFHSPIKKCKIAFFKYTANCTTILVNC